MDNINSVIKNLPDPSIYNNLSEKEKLLVGAKLLGYQKMPPSIDEFLTDSYYLGGEGGLGTNLYPYWKKFLRKLFPTPIHTRWHYIALSGAIN